MPPVRALILASALLLGLTSTHVRAAELLMFEEKWCHWCEKWNDEIGVVYHNDDRGQTRTTTTHRCA